MMPKSWRDYQSGEAPPGPSDNSDNSDESPAAEAGSPPNVPNVPNVTGLPSDVRRGLAWLANAPAPRRSSPEAWACAVRDAAGLAESGWAGTALALGWSPLDLFGASLDAKADPCCVGLAAWLEGRKVLALTEHWAAAENRRGDRFYFNRPRAEGARFLWALNG